MKKRVKMIGASKGITFTQEDMAIEGFEVGDIIEFTITAIHKYNNSYNKEELDYD